MSYSRALIVDDSKIARVTLKKKLEQRGLETVVAEHAQQALDLLKTEAVDVIFMDHMMPGMDGFEATQQIKANESTAHVPVIMCSGKENEDYLDQARAIGAANVLPKPTANDALDAVFAQLENPAPAPIQATAAIDSSPAEKAVGNLDQEATRSPASTAEAPAQFHALLTPLSQQVSSLGQRLTELHSDIAAQVAASAEAIESIHAMEQKQAAARAASEEAIKDELAALMDERVAALYVPAVEEAQDKTRATLHAELMQALEEKLRQSMATAVEQLKAVIPVPPSEHDIEQHIARATDQRVQSLHKNLQRSQQQLGAALRVELERHINAELARQIPPAPDLEALRESLQQDLRATIAESLADIPAPSSNRLPIALTLLSTVIAGVAVALHFVI